MRLTGPFCPFKVPLEYLVILGRPVNDVLPNRSQPSNLKTLTLSLEDDLTIASPVDQSLGLPFSTSLVSARAQEEVVAHILGIQAISVKYTVELDNASAASPP